RWKHHDLLRGQALPQGLPASGRRHQSRAGALPPPGHPLARAARAPTPRLPGAGLPRGRAAHDRHALPLRDQRGKRGLAGAGGAGTLRGAHPHRAPRRPPGPHAPAPPGRAGAPGAPRFDRRPARRVSRQRSPRRDWRRPPAHAASHPRPPPPPPLAELAHQEPPDSLAAPIGAFRANARLAGIRVAELHRSLSTGGPEFEPQPYGTMDQRSLYQSMRNVAGTALRELRLARSALSAFARPLAEEVLAIGPAIYDLFAPLLTMRLTAKRARIHGTLDLRNVLWLGKDYVFVDFEGDRRRSPADRRRKRSPLRDLATMLLSYQRIATTACFDPALVREDDRDLALLWADAWIDWSGAAFLGRSEERRGGRGSAWSGLGEQET